MCAGYYVKVQLLFWYNMNLWYPLFLLVDDSNSPSVLEQLPQGLSLNCYTFISDCSQFSDVSYALCLVPSFLKHGQSYALVLALDLMFPSVVIVLTLLTSSPGVLQLPFYLGYSPIEFWDSLSGCVHPGIACLAFWVSDQPGAFWASLFNYPPLLGVYPSMTFVNFFNAYGLGPRPLLHLYVYVIGHSPRPSYIFPLTKTAYEMGK